ISRLASWSSSARKISGSPSAWPKHSVSTRRLVRPLIQCSLGQKMRALPNSTSPQSCDCARNKQELPSAPKRAPEMADITSTRKLGSSGLSVPVLGFGAAPLGGVYRALSEAEADATVTAAHEAGLRYFDVAPFYGLGLAEHRLGRSLRASRNDCVV